MLKVTKRLLQGSFIAIAIFITLFIGFLSLIQLSDTVQSSFFDFENGDKVQHFIAYTTLGLSWFFAIKRARKNWATRMTIVGACIFYGIIIEVLQTTLTSYRTADYKDIIANSTGILLSLFIFKAVLKKKEII